jgi:hypothetical protein
MRIEGLKKYRDRNPRGYFEEALQIILKPVLSRLPE